MKVQQELLRHSDIRTTMNIYTHTVSPALRQANSKVVRMILPEEMKTSVKSRAKIRGQSGGNGCSSKGQQRTYTDNASRRVPLNSAAL